MNDCKRSSQPLGIFLVLLIVATPAAFAQQRTLTLDDYGAVSWPDSARISPDGTRITYILDGQLFLRSLGFAEPKVLTGPEEGAWDSRWSADGEWIYFIADSGEGSQVFKQHLEDSTQSIQVSNFKLGVYGFNLSPDQTRVLLRASENDLVESTEEAEPQPIVITGRGFKTDSGDGYVRQGDKRYIYLYDFESQGMRRISSGQQSEWGAAWSADGKSIVLVKGDGDFESYQSDLWVYTNEANATSTPVRLTNTERSKSSPVFSPDGRQIAYLSAGNGQFSLGHIAVVPATGGEPRILTKKLDRSVSAIEYSADGKWIYFSYANAGAVSLARVRVSDSKIESIIDDDQVVNSFDVAASGDIAVIATVGDDSSNVYRYSEGHTAQLTDASRSFFNEVLLGERVKKTFIYGGDIEVDTFITTPPGYKPGKAYPTLLRLHGGPYAQFSWGFSFTNQFYASLGYVVIEPNPRGSIGRGQAFTDAMVAGWGVADYDDVMAAVDYAIAEGYSDPENLFVTGYSYGGLLTNAVITQTDRFNAAASGAGHSLMEANFGHDIHERWWLWELGAPWENRELYDKNSPMRRVESVVTPTLFLTGQLDFNVPALNSEVFYLALKVRDVDTKLVIYPGMHHGGWTTAFEKDYLMQISAWFEAYRN